MKAILLCVLLVAVPAVDASTSVAFETPAHFTGAVASENATWLLLVFPQHHWQANATLEGEMELDEYQYQAVNRPRIMGPPTEVLSQWSEPIEREARDSRLRFEPTEPWAAIFVRANAIQTETSNTSLSLKNGPDLLDPRWTWFPADVPKHTFRRQFLDPDQPLLASAEAIVPEVRVRVEGLRSVEVRGASASCGGTPCAHSELQDHAGLVHQTSSWRWSSEGGVLSVTGRDVLVMTGGAGVDVTAHGSIRLPDLRTALVDLEQLGVSVQGQTLRGEGELTLRDIRTRADGTARGWLSTDLEAVRLDESPLVVRATASVSAVATVTLLGLVLWKGKAVASFLGGLFTRLDMDGALEHPNRRALFEYVDENPGTTFRELIRATGLAAGTARHHIAVLARCGVLIERPFGQTLRYFHCEQEQVGDWDAVVVLRHPELDRMYRWLLDNPGVMQRQILDEAETWGWRRSTAQHRLKRLVDNRLASVRDLGRSKSYQARVVDIR